MAQASSAQREPSMEEILASIRRIIEDGETERKDEQPAVEPARGEVEAFRAELKPISGGPQNPALESEEAAVEAPQRLAWRDEAEEAVASSNLDDVLQPPADGEEEPLEASAPEAPAAWQPQAAQPEPSRTARPPILSETSGRKVAAAFEELGEAFEASRQRKLEETAEAMLRPMLQEWLDNNLPQLVERLVREEIERVARGS